MADQIFDFPQDDIPAEEKGKKEPPIKKPNPPRGKSIPGKPLFIIAIVSLLLVGFVFILQTFLGLETQAKIFAVQTVTQSAKIALSAYSKGLTNVKSAKALQIPGIVKTFGATTIPLGGTTTLNFTITNPITAPALTNMAFTDTLPAGLTVANTTTIQCGGTLTTTAVTGLISLSGGSIATGASCTFNVTVTGTTAGQKNNVTSFVTSTEGSNDGRAEDNIKVVAPPSIAKTFGADTILVGGTTTLSFKITNPNTTTVLIGVAFTDTLPAGLTVASSSTTQCGGTLTTTAATGVISLSGGSIAAGGSCTFNVTVTGTTAWFLKNTTGNVTSTNGGKGNTATDSIWVESPKSHK
jgi:large repetitive protein